MTQVELKNDLRSMVRQYGYEQVDQALREIGDLDQQPEILETGTQPAGKRNATKGRAIKSRPTAPEYVAKLGLPRDKESIMTELAARFHDKSFLPMFSDISNFCQIYGIEEPASKSRAAAIPRVFKFIAEMEADAVQTILGDGMFSGPSRLGPIADAIRGNGRAKTAASGSAQNSRSIHAK